MKLSNVANPVEFWLRVRTEGDLTLFEWAESGTPALDSVRHDDVREFNFDWGRLRVEALEPSVLRRAGEAMTKLLPLRCLAALQTCAGRGLKEGRGLRIRIDAQASGLADAPWEWLYLTRQTPFDPIEGHLALASNVRLVRESQQPVSISESDDLRVLVAVADPGSPRFAPLPWLAAEARSIASAFAACRRRRVELRTMVDTMPSSLELALHDFRPHLVHFAGHGEGRPGGGILVLKGPTANTDRGVPGDQLALWLASAGTQMVFLSACDTAGAPRSTVEALVRGKVPTVIGMQTAISDAAQPHFARVFYGALLSGARVDEAVAEARQSSGGGSNVWASSVLYLQGAPLGLFTSLREESWDESPNNLPRFDSPLLQRDREVEGILDHLRDSRLLVLVGPGGIGKTRLAVEAGKLALPDFPDGVWRVECEACSNEESVLFTIAQTLGIEHDGKSVAESLGAYLETRRTLLILDCFESVVAAGNASFVERFLVHPFVSVLVTSRFRLGAAAETVFEVPALDAGQGHGFELLLQSAGLQGKPLSAEDEQRLGEVCAALEGVPLALVIAAGRLRLLGVEKLQALLAASPLATLGGRSAGVSAAIRRSLDLIEADDRYALRELAVFAGSFSWDEIAEVYPDDPFERLENLAHLVDRSLLQSEAQGEERRFRILDSLREYLQSPDEGGGANPVLQAGRERHLALYVKRAQSIADLMEQGRWVEAVGDLWAALPNLRAALQFAVEAERDESTDLLCRSLGMIFIDAGMWRDFERLARAGHLAANRNGWFILESILLSLEGVVRSHQGDPSGAEEIWLQRVELCRRSGIRGGAVDALMDIATQAIGAEEFDKARRWIDEAALELEGLERNDLRIVLMTLRSRYFYQIGDYDESFRYADEAEALLSDPATSNTTIFVVTNLSRIWRQRGNDRIVRIALENAMRDAFVRERPAHVAFILREIAQGFREDSQYEAAGRSLAGIVGIFREVGNYRLRQAEKELEAFRDEFPELATPFILDHPWRVQVQAVLDHLAALAAEETS